MKRNNLKQMIFTRHFAGKSSVFNGKLTIMILICTYILTCNGCKKLTDVNPPTTSITGASAYTSDATAAAVMTGLYTNLSGSAGGNTSTAGTVASLSLFPGMSSDELTYKAGLKNTTALAYYTNSLLSSASIRFGTEYWIKLYPYIFTCNDAITGLNASTTLTPAVKQQLLGEAKYMRAFFYFYLVNLYGDLPLALTNDYKINDVLARSPKTVVYQQIITDLKDAQNLLSKTYLDASLSAAYPERVRPTYWAATALLSRVYLFNGNLTGDNSNYTNSETQASSLIGNTSLFNLSPLTNTFLRFSLGNNEAIWQLQPVTSNPYNTYDARVFIAPATGPGTGGINYGAYLSNYLVSSFEAGDNRKTVWTGKVTAGGITYYFPFKYKVASTVTTVSEFPTLLRLGEQYLIRAEARAQLGENNAQDDLNAIRTRAGLPNYAGAIDKASLLAAILHERQVELFAELGQRWLDLKRTGSVDVVMGTGGVCAAKGGTWVSGKQLYPIFFNDLQDDANLVQNPGY